MQCRKSIGVEHNKKIMSTASYINVYIYLTCDRMAQNKNLLNKLITAEWSSF